MTLLIKQTHGGFQNSSMRPFFVSTKGENPIPSWNEDMSKMILGGGNFD